MFEISEVEKLVTLGAKIRVIGVGGGGCNAVNTMIKSGLDGVEYIVANTDQQALEASLAPTKIQLGVEITKGLGAGANPEIGRKAALDEYEKISEVLEGSDMVFITAGMGGGTGTGAAPIIAKLARELGALTVGVVTKPFLFEGRKRTRQAKEGIASLEENVDSLITIPNQRLLFLAGENLSLVDTFKKADEVLLNAVRGISDLINTNGHINVDFADVSTVMNNKGLALMGTGTCSGTDRAIKAATEAISSPLLEDISIDGATGIIINITGNESLTMHEANEAAMLIMEAADEDAEVIFGSVIDPDMEENIKVTVIATGLGGLEKGVAVSNAATAMNATAQITPSVQTMAERIDAVETSTAAYKAPVQENFQSSTVAQKVIHPEPTVNTFVEETPMAQPFQSAPVKTEERLYERTTEVEETTSSLAQSIKEAAARYETTKTVQAPVESYQSTNTETAATTRTKSIAEKLGFINFDEEELDTPSFLRKEETTIERKDRPLEL